ncbi:MAG: MBL fold metallo-hydrolase, partial [Lachnospira sp.]
MRMMPIASGSSGNCIYVGTDNTHILLDAGISRKRIDEGLHMAGLSIKDI